MKTLSLNSVYTKSATIGLDADVKLDHVVADAINAGILQVTDKARRVDAEGNLVSIDHKALTDECAAYIALCSPVLAHAIVKQVIKAATTLGNSAEGSQEHIAAARLHERAIARLPQDNGRIITTDLAFISMSAADFKSYEHADKKLLAKYRDDKRGILRMNFRRLVEAAHAIKKTATTKEETWPEILARVAKSFNGEKTAPKWIAAGITADDMAHAFLILEKGRKFAESAKLQQAAKNGKAAAKQAAK